MQGGANSSMLGPAHQNKVYFCEGFVLLSVDHVHDIGVLADSLYQTIVTLNLHPHWHNQNIEILDKKRSWKVWSNWGLKINLRARYTISSWQEVKSRSNPGFEILEGIDDVDNSTWFTEEGHERQRLTRNTAYLRSLVAASQKQALY